MQFRGKTYCDKFIVLGNMMKIEWNKERIKKLKKYYPSESWDVICKEIGSSNKAAIMSKASKMKIKRNYDVFKNFGKSKSKSEKYTNQEDEWLKENYKTKNVRALSLELDKSINSIIMRLRKLGVHKNAWSKEDIKLLKEVYPIYPNNYIQEKYFPHKNKSSIRSFANKNNIVKNIKQDSKWYVEENMLEKYKKLAKKLNRTPTHADINTTKNMPSSKTYERYFGSLAKLAQKCNLLPNRGIYNSSIVSLSSAGDVCDSNAEYIITEYFIKNKINYKKEVRYSDYIQDELCNTKTCDWVVNGIFIEYFGLPDKEEYYKKMQVKRNLLKKHKIELIELFKKDLTRLDEKFEKLSQ
jgi:hypothetical protein